jgi:hypothetical protein
VALGYTWGFIYVVGMAEIVSSDGACAEEKYIDTTTLCFELELCCSCASCLENETWFSLCFDRKMDFHILQARQYSSSYVIHDPIANVQYVIKLHNSDRLRPAHLAKKGMQHICPLARLHMKS